MGILGKCIKLSVFFFEQAVFLVFFQKYRVFDSVAN